MSIYQPSTLNQGNGGTYVFRSTYLEPIPNYVMGPSNYPIPTDMSYNYIIGSRPRPNIEPTKYMTLPRDPTYPRPGSMDPGRDFRPVSHVGSGRHLEPVSRIGSGRDLEGTTRKLPIPTRDPILTNPRSNNGIMSPGRDFNSAILLEAPRNPKQALSGSNDFMSSWWDFETALNMSTSRDTLSGNPGPNNGTMNTGCDSEPATQVGPPRDPKPEFPKPNCPMGSGRILDPPVIGGPSLADSECNLIPPVTGSSHPIVSNQTYLGMGFDESIIHERANWFSISNNVLAQILECSVCKDIPIPPITQCKTGHLVCKICCETIKNCRICGEHMTETRNLAVEELFLNIIPVRNSVICEKGCNAKNERDDKEGRMCR